VERRQVVVGDGKLYIWPEKWELIPTGDEPTELEYRGEAVFSGDYLMIEVGRTTVWEYKIGKIVNLDYIKGWEKAKSQKTRRSYRVGSSEEFYGWMACWDAKKRGWEV